MANKLSTSFSFDDKDFSKIDTLKTKLTEANNLFNNFGGSVNFTQKINSDFDELNKKLGLLDNNLKKLGNSELTGKELKSLSADLQQQARAQKLVEQAKRATLQTAVEEVKLERQKIGLQRESLALEAAKQKLSGKKDSDLKNALSDIRRYQQESIRSEKELTRQIEREAKLQSDIRIREGKRAANDAIRTLNERPKASFFDSLVSTKNLAAGAFSAVAGSQLVDITDRAIERSIEASRANRLLASSATEAGIAYGILADKNLKVADTFGLSTVAASQITAKIQQLATFTGNPGQFDQLQKRFGDIAAAKGVDSKDLSALIGTILSGQDEGLNRLGISDPGQLYKAYAKEIGKTADTLTQFEKVQAAVNAVVSKGAIFDGTAEARMNSLEGSTAKASAAFENLKNSLSTAATGNIYFQNSLDFINQGLKSMSFNIDEVRRKLKQGFTPEDIANEELNSPLNQSLGAVSSFGSTIFGIPALTYDILTGNENAYQNYFGAISPEATRGRAFQQRVSQIKNQQKLDSAQEQDALGEQSKTQSKILSDSFNARLDAFIKPTSDGVEKARRSLDDLNKLQKDFVESFGKFGNIARLNDSGGLNLAAGINNVISDSIGGDPSAIKDKINLAARAFYTEDAKFNVNKFLENPYLQGAEENLKVLGSIKKYLSDDTFDELSGKLNKFIEEAKLLKTELTTFAAESALSDNPFVKLFADADSAGERMEKRFKTLGDEYVQLATTIERNNIFKKVNELSYQSDTRALTSEQNAFRTSRIRDNELGGFTRALETVNKTLEFTVKMFELDKKISEADFYGRKYNPNNPKTFDQSRFSFGERYRFSEAAGQQRRGESLQEFEKRRQEAIESGIKIFDAFNEIKGLKNLSLDGTGIFGEGALADKILGLLPSRDDLLLRLKSPYVSERDRAQSLLSEQSNALRTQKELENRKLQDFIYDQQTKGLNQKFAGEQLNLLNEQKFLTPLDRAKAKVDILNPLGNDISPQQRRELYENQQAVAKYERQQKEEAQGYLRNINEKLNAIITANGIKIDGGSLPQLQENGTNPTATVIVKDETKNGVNSTGTMEDVSNNYGFIREGFANSLGGYRGK